ncbi:hypothetical protein LK996_04960 [Lysobacter sp. A6]|uniref:Lipoprotein n=1 Tax=Noviluteimonas lactosilytica TaxID=2888523 RepID=A0ABS8JFN6_9GAMM|nr:hypothetical protein [Lysobacter lactosilyticus]MCC8362421.1 hypothetical protein [Lysobacter lactosilyticus]
MKRTLRLFAAHCVLLLAACATVAGTAIGAGIGSVSGNTAAGAMIGGGVGMMVDVID